MSSSRFAILARVLAVSCCLDAACAADPGDSPKSPPSGPGPADDSGVPSLSQVEDSSEPSMEPETGTAVSDGDDASAVADAAAVDDAVVEANVDTNVDAACALQNIPSSCPNCMTQNASDMPVCEMYVHCFIENNCNPGTACGSNDGVCGVNTIGGGEAPYQAAVQTYDCACP